MADYPRACTKPLMRAGVAANRGQAIILLPYHLCDKANGGAGGVATAQKTRLTACQAGV